ncbi:hypothetical protein [[Clostridium] fimetarium]|uniref:Uncharacterized protein n=1 Tax=[Clostridium] fimetarium TaxID=99656 RepID=A0A1I0NJX6_9FIRM|nr:hypothetical protein [[Clostridium] fimetarium]SEW01804.1 hypothetical protein SAMN05421659_103172 [[Clostridium] fimetarium]
MKIVKRSIASISIIALIISAALGIQKGLFDEFFNQLKNNDVASEAGELTTYNSAEAQTKTASDTGQNAAANAPKLATFDESLFYDLGEDIYCNYGPSVEKGEIMVNVKSAFISDELDPESLKFLDDPEYFSRRLEMAPDTYPNGYYIVSVEIQFTNIGTTKTSWSTGNCYLYTFDRNGKVDINKRWMATFQDGKISGGGVFKKGEIFLQPGETALCKWTDLIRKEAIDNLKDRKEQLYFTPSNMYYRSWHASNGTGRLAFVELPLEVN